MQRPPTITATLRPRLPSTRSPLTTACLVRRRSRRHPIMPAVHSSLTIMKLRAKFPPFYIRTGKVTRKSDNNGNVRRRTCQSSSIILVSACQGYPPPSDRPDMVSKIISSLIRLQPASRSSPPQTARSNAHARVLAGRSPSRHDR